MFSFDSINVRRKTAKFDISSYYLRVSKTSNTVCIVTNQLLQSTMKTQHLIWCSCFLSAAMVNDFAFKS